MSTFDTRCECGWLLPVCVAPMRNVDEESIGEDSIIPNAIVTLDCPVCYTGHVFYSAQEAVKASPDMRERLGLVVSQRGYPIRLEELPKKDKKS